MSDVGQYTRQAGLTEDLSEDGTPGTVNWHQAAAEWFGTEGTPEPRKVLGYVRRMHSLALIVYGSMRAYWRAHSPPEVDPSLATWEQLRTVGAVGRFSPDPLSQGENADSDVRRRVRVDALGMDDNQAFGLEMAFAAGVDDVGRAVDLATRSMDAPSILSSALGREPERREKILHLIEADEFGQARALATCGQMSIQLGCPTHGGGCGCEDNYVPVSCDSRICPDCMNSRIGNLVERYTQPALGWKNPVFGTFTMENVTATDGEELRRAVDALQGAFGRLRDRTIPPEGEVVREVDGAGTTRKRWVWKDDGGEPATDYWYQDLVRRGYRDRADRLQAEYVEAEWEAPPGNVQRGKQIPFGELVDAGIYAVDIKQVDGDEFNLHLHTLWDGAYIPQPALSAVWEELVPGSPVVDVRRVYDRDGGSLESAIMEVVAYACKPPEFEDTEQEVHYVKALKGKRLVQTFGDLHGEVPDVEPSLLCSECNQMPAWWDYLGTVDERIDNMGSIHDGESTGCDPPA